MAAAAAAVMLVLIFAVAIIVAAAFAAHALFNYRGKRIELVLVGGNEFLHIAVYDYLHDIYVVAAVALLIFAVLAFLAQIHEHRVLLAFVFKVIDNVQFKVVTVVIGKGHKIPFHFFHR